MNHKFNSLLGVIFIIFFLTSVAFAQPPFQVTHETCEPPAMRFAWSPDGTQFAYTAMCNDELKLYRINLDGTGKTFLADSVLTKYDGCVDWKGDYIVFKALSSKGINPYYMLLRRIKPNGTGEKDIYGPYWYGDFVLQPGGEWLLFREAPGGWWVARRINIDGSDAKTVSHNSLVQRIGWLGKSRILYSRGANYYTSCRIYRVNFDGSDLKELTPFDLPNNATFSASPDAEKILYENKTSGYWDIWIMNADGSHKKQLTSHPKNDVLSWPLQKNWTPDSKSFFFSSDRSGKGDIYKMNKDGTGLTQITFSDSIDYNPTLSPDGTKLAFLSKRDGYTNIWVIDFEKIHVFIPDTTGGGNNIIDIPVRVTDLTGKGIYSFGMTVETNPTILIPQGAVTTGTLSEPWGDATFNVDGGKIKVAMAESTPLAGSGTLIYLRYLVAPYVSSPLTTSIEMTNFIFNDGQPEVVLHDGSFTAIWKFDVSGMIKYYKNDIPLPDVEVSLDGHEMTTGNSGEFKFKEVLFGNYTLRPEKTGTSAYAVAPYDAALILMSMVHLINLTPYQKIAADVTGNGGLSGLDASYILRYYVGLVPGFPVGKDWTFVPLGYPINNTNWSTAPDTIRYEPLNEDKTDQDFVGIVYGDVSGNWDLPKAAAGQWLARSNSQPKLSVEDIQRQKDGTYAISIVLSGIHDVVATGLTCQYDPNQFQFLAAELNSIASPEPMIFSRAENGTIRLALATAQPIQENRLKITYHFRSTNSIEKIQPGAFSVKEISINGNYFQVDSQPAGSPIASALPEQFQLSQNYPNPFNSSTLIKYQLPKPGFLTIKIYNLLGQKIRTLVAEQKEAGFHQISWDGRDDWNEAVGSGEYICQMRVGDFVAVRKAVLIR